MRAANTFHRVFKLSPELQDATGPKEVDIVLHKHANTAEAVAPYLDEVGVPTADANVSYRKIRVEASPEALAQIQQWESVKQITPVLPNQLYNDQARVALHDDVVTAANNGSNAGQGQVVAVNDSGFDLGAVSGKTLPATVPTPFAGRIVAVLAGSSAGTRNPGTSSDEVQRMYADRTTLQLSRMTFPATARTSAALLQETGRRLQWVAPSKAPLRNQA